MKKKKTIFILGIFLVLLIGVYGIIIMNNKKQKEEETTQTETQETKTLLNLYKTTGDSSHSKHTCLYVGVCMYI